MKIFACISIGIGILLFPVGIATALSFDPGCGNIESGYQLFVVGGSLVSFGLGVLLGKLT